MRVKDLRLPGVFAGAAVTALVVVACGGGGATPTPPRLPTTAEYLQRVGDLESPVDQASRTVDRALLEAAHVRRDVFTMLREADFAGAQATLLQEAQQVQPPGDLRADHQAYLEWLRDAGVPFSREMAGAIQSLDLAAFVVARARHEVSRITFLAGVSPAFCRTLNPENDLLLPNDHFCDNDETLVGGQYGVQVRALIKRLAAEFGARTGVFRPALRENEQLEAVAAVQPDVVSLFEEILEAAQGLQPPAELRADHDRLIQLLVDSPDVARSVLRAAGEQDFNRLFHEFRRSRLYRKSAERAFSPAIRPLIAAFFGEAQEDQMVLTAAEAQYLDRLDAGVSKIEAAFASARAPRRPPEDRDLLGGYPGGLAGDLARGGGAGHPGAEAAVPRVRRGLLHRGSEPLGLRQADPWPPSSPWARVQRLLEGCPRNSPPMSLRGNLVAGPTPSRLLRRLSPPRNDCHGLQ